MGFSTGGAPRSNEREPLPKDDHLPRGLLPQQPGFLSRILGGVLGANGRRRDLPGMHEELFRMRGELALARAELEQIRAAVGRRDIATLEELLRAGNRREIEALIRDRVQTVPMPDGTVLCRLLGRFKFFVDAADFAMTPHLLLDGYWEYWVTEFLCRNLGRGETAIDVGTGYGYYAIIMADLVGPQGRILALEPNPWLNALAARNLSINGRDPVKCLLRAAVAESSGGQYRQPASQTGPRGGSASHHFDWQDDNAFTVAPTIALDEAETGHADFIRIASAHGAEKIWDGMQGLVGRSQSIKVLMDFKAHACADPAGFLARISAEFPLRFLDGDARAKPISAEDLLARRPEATLYLSRVDPR